DVGHVERSQRERIDHRCGGRSDSRLRHVREKALSVPGGGNGQLPVNVSKHTSALIGSLDMLSTCNYPSNMSKMIQLRHVPDALHRQLKARAALSGLPLSDYLIREVRKIAEQPTLQEMQERLRQRDAYRGKISPTDIVRAERDSR